MLSMLGLVLISAEIRRTKERSHGIEQVGFAGTHRVEEQAQGLDQEATQFFTVVIVVECN